MYKSRTRLRCGVLAALPAFLASVSTLAGADIPSYFKARAFYAQSPRFWATVAELRRRDHTLAEVHDLLQDRFSEPEEGVATLQVRYYDRSNEVMRSTFSHTYFGMRGDLLAGGIVRNRVFPEVTGFRTTTGQIEFGFEENPEPSPLAPGDSTRTFRLGGVIGLGDHEHVDALAIDLYPRAPIRKENLVFAGLDLNWNTHERFDDEWRTDFEASLSPSFFHASAGPDGQEYDLERNAFTWRWRALNEWWWQPVPDRVPSVELSILGVVGPQPVPTVFLPRTWDAVHHLEIAPNLGQLVGLGSSTQIRSDDERFGARVTGGLFGGYWGATASARLAWFEASVGTLGLEQTTSFRVIESRMKYAQAGVNFEI